MPTSGGNYQIRQIHKIAKSGGQGDVSFNNGTSLPLPNDVAKNMTSMIALLNDDNMRNVSDALENPSHFIKLSKYALKLHQAGMLKPAEQQPANEETIIDELTKDTLKSYIRSATNDRVKQHNSAMQKHAKASFYKDTLADDKKAKGQKDQAVRHEKKADKRDIGTRLANIKLNRTLPDSWKTKAPEIKEMNIDEKTGLSNKTLSSYIKGASKDVDAYKKEASRNYKAATDKKEVGHTDSAEASSVKGDVFKKLAQRRLAGIHKATKNLKNEETIDEKKHTSIAKDSVRTLAGITNKTALHKHHKKGHRVHTKYFELTHLSHAK